ncbi:MAG: sirohydrochlorin cobaltochelatase, partial [Desulfuromonas sp.]
MNNTAILLIGHGSRVAEANDALHAIAAMVREQKPGTVVEVAFRE